MTTHLTINLKKFCQFLLFLFFITSQKLQASQTISPEIVVDSTLKHYPKILAYYEKITETEGDVLQNQGLFDIKLKQKYQANTKGFYTNNNFDIVLEKQNAFLGSKVYAGYRKSYGNFPDYDNKYLTNNNGEYRLGASVSLLQNNMFDKNRLALANAKLNNQESKLQLAKMQAEIIKDAKQAYWKWFLYGKIYIIYQDLYQLALERDKQLQIRLQQGDIANIVAIENKRNILNRKNIMLEAKQDFLNSCFYLSLFYRQENGAPQNINEKTLPSSSLPIKLNHITEKNLEQDIQQAMQFRPEMQILKVKQNKEQNYLKQAKNMLQPSLDLSFETSQDLGKGSVTRKETVNNVKLDFDLPLQQRDAKGQEIKAEANIKYLSYEQQLLTEKIQIEIKQIGSYINILAEIYHNAEEEFKLSQKLATAEKERFKQGGSDFFLINLREQELARAHISKIQAIEKYYHTTADYNFAINIAK
jgi:outer membrane protein TolC